MNLSSGNIFNWIVPFIYAIASYYFPRFYVIFSRYFSGNLPVFAWYSYYYK